jgi:ABC-2 type transport system permease protein
VTTRREIDLVTRRETKERWRSRSLRVSTAIQLLIVVGAVAIANLTGGDGAESAKLGVAGPQAAAVGAAVKERDDAFALRVTVRRLGDERAARAAVANDEVDAALAGTTLFTSSGVPDALPPLVQDASRDVRGAALLRREGVGPGEARAALQPPPLRETEVTSGQQGAGLAFVGSLLLYIGLITFGYTLSGGIVEEKSSRVIEVVLSTIRPVSVLTGKVIGIGVVGLLQLLLIGGAGIAAALLTGEADLPSSTAATAILVAVFFVLGYALYACAFAAAGAIVSRQEDVQSTTSPLLAVLIGAYLASISAIDNPTGALAEVLSYLPPAAPLIVPGRVAQDAMGAGEVAISIALMIVSTVLVMRMAARIYERSILRVGAPLKVVQAWRLARQPQA